MTSDKTKGTRDYEPLQATRKERIKQVITATLKQYGYAAMDTPVIEHRDILTSKFTGGEEILKEMYTLQDQGERKLGLRYDLTVPLARFMAEHPEYKKPFRRRQAGKVFRDGPVKPGRYREFEQYDFDIIGEDSVVAEAELIQIIRTVLEKLGLQPTIHVNSRKVLFSLLENIDIGVDKASVILTLDKYEKKGRQGVVEELMEKGVREQKANKLLSILSVGGSNQHKIEQLEEHADLLDIKQVAKMLEAYDCEWTFNPYLARGLNYYTGIIFEVFDKDTGVTSSLSAGGRYDDMIGALSKKDVSAVGASFGIDTLLDAVQHDEAVHSKDIYVIPLDDVEKIIPLVQRIRSQDVHVTLGSPQKHFRKNLDYADKQGYGYLLVIGSDELESDVFEVKNLQTGEKTKTSLENIHTVLEQ